LLIKEEEKSPAVDETDTANEIPAEKVDETPVKKILKADEPKKETEVAEETGVIDETAKEAKVEVGKSYKITDEKEMLPIEQTKKDDKKKVKKSASAKKDPEYEVKKEEVVLKEDAKFEESTVFIPNESASIIKKRPDTGRKKAESMVTTAEKAKSEKPETKKAAATLLKTKSSQMYDSIKTGSIKVSKKIAKPFKSGSPSIKKTFNVMVDVSKRPVISVSKLDRKITKSMKKVVNFENTPVDKTSLLKNIASADKQITNKAKKFIDSILG
jgi:hypothetical protein